ncbi:hypothetical protein LshimejAT787_0806430 [Lyophyllum shimeji]|uniref:Nitrogen regulatory protein areA GATA-like domain-containing protein n=1 Tax=Lyophyllum shimeji TaxID=47721 RepID=A0A9P3PSY3_LYOSH|nr:hypothetical protein LshimejAT787_0806430 [Lyophyllum shimeji]
MAPTFEFPVPVLSVAAEAVRELEGGEALCGLWTLFTKCKASLQDGHRLENISWRLWYREMAAERPKAESEKDSWDDSRLFDEKASQECSFHDDVKVHLETQEILLSRTGQSLPSAAVQVSVSSPRPDPQAQPNASPLSISRPTLVRRNSYVGRIIVDMLPNPLPPTQYPISRSIGLSSDANANFITSYFSPAIRTSSIVPPPSDPATRAANTGSTSMRCHLPTPAASEERAVPPSSLPKNSPDREAAARASSPAPQVQVQVSAPSTPPPAPALPRLVVVNPTPGPTPHPTPPATPYLGAGTGMVTVKLHDGHRTHGMTSDSLMPMPKLPQPMFVLADGSTTSSSSSASSGSGRTVASSPSTTVSTCEVAAPSHKAEATILTTVPAAAPATSAANTTTKSGSPTPVAPPLRKASSSGSSSGHLLPEPARAPQAGPSRARPRAQGHIRQTSSASSAGGGRGTGRPVEVGRNKSKSTSRSRSRGADAGLAGLTMTLAAAAGGAKKGVVVGGKGRALGPLRRSGSARAGVGGRAGREKRPTFNIGSHSDEGSALGSKSAGSGSSVSGPKHEVEARNNISKPATAQAPLQRTQSSTRLPPPPSAQNLPDLAQVIPPQQQRRTIVLATSDSDDYETETDTDSGSDNGRVHKDGEEEDGDTGEWSSEDVSADDVEVVVMRGGQQQAQASAAQAQANNHTHTSRRNHSQPQLNHAQAPSTQQQQHQHQPQQHQPHLSRAQQSRRNQAAHAQYVVEQAALEAQRIREMFAKKPVPSQEQLAWKRTRSVGLLTQLMNPDPKIFPPSHPYRRGHSSGEIKGVGGGLTMTAPGSGSAGERRASEQGLGLGQARGRGQGQAEQRRPSAGMAPGLKLSKSSAALPIASQVQVGSVAREAGVGMAAAAAVAAVGSGSGGYRPRARPADQEMEDDSDSDGEENGRDAVLGSKSVVQEKLEAFARRRGIVANEKKDAATEEAEPVPEWLREPEVARNGRMATQPLSNGASSSQHGQQRRQEQHPAPAPTPAPIPVGHPYNLPPPAPPSTPRTTRRLMLQTEMSESLRRNLLWERQVSKINLGRIRRTASGGGAKGGAVLGGGLRPLTALPSMVQLTAREQGAGANGNGAGRPEDRERERRGSGGAVTTEAEHEREERKKKAMARNRSWANDYHYSGW